MPGIVKTEPAEDIKPFEKFRQLPPPPSPQKANPKNSALTTLSNGCVANGRELKFIENAQGEAHRPWWTIICTIDGEEYGQSESRRKAEAKACAAEKALGKLEREGQTFITSSLKYMTVFNDYLEQKKLRDRITFVNEAEGPEHARSWKVALLCDGVEISSGRAQKVQDAKEEAAREFARSWEAVTVTVKSEPTD